MRLKKAEIYLFLYPSIIVLFQESLKPSPHLLSVLSVELLIASFFSTHWRCFRSFISRSFLSLSLLPIYLAIPLFHYIEYPDTKGWNTVGTFDYSMNQYLIPLLPNLVVVCIFGLTIYLLEGLHVFKSSSTSAIQHRSAPATTDKKDQLTSIGDKRTRSKPISLIACAVYLVIVVGSLVLAANAFFLNIALVGVESNQNVENIGLYYYTLRFLVPASLLFFLPLYRRNSWILFQITYSILYASLQISRRSYLLSISVPLAYYLIYSQKTRKNKLIVLLYVVFGFIAISFFKSNIYYLFEPGQPFALDLGESLQLIPEIYKRSGLGSSLADNPLSTIFMLCYKVVARFGDPRDAILSQNAPLSLFGGAWGYVSYIFNQSTLSNGLDLDRLHLATVGMVMLKGTVVVFGSLSSLLSPLDPSKYLPQLAFISIVLATISRTIYTLTCSLRPWVSPEVAVLILQLYLLATVLVMGTEVWLIITVIALSMLASMRLLKLLRV